MPTISEIRQKYPQYSDISDGELVRGLHKKFYSDVKYADFLKNIDFREKAYDPTKDMNFGETAAAGLGKMMVDTGRGVKQLLGMDGGKTLSGLVTGDERSQLQKTIDEEAELSRPLMNTAGGITGNIAGHVGMALLPGAALVRAGNLMRAPGLAAAGRAAMAPGFTPGGMALGGSLGAAQGAIPAVATGDSRAENAIWGGVGGAVVPFLGMLAKVGRAAVQPLHEGGREQIVGNALRAATGANADAVAARLDAGTGLIPGSQPTAAEVGESAGLAAMQRAASAADPEQYANRAAQNNLARTEAIRDAAGTSGQREFYDAARRDAAQTLYNDAYARGVDLRRDPTTGQFLTKSEIAGRKGEINKLLQRPAIQDAMEKARTLAANEGINMRDPAGSVQGLDYLQRALKDAADAAQGNEARILGDLRRRLLTTIDALSPRYAEARTTFANMSRPINQMDVIQQIADRSIRPLDDVMQPAAFARAMSDDTAQAVTGMRNATLANTLEPGQLNMLNALKEELRRVQFAQNAGRGAGSDTLQKLAMSNLMSSAGLPVGLADVVGINRLGRLVYGPAEEAMRNRLAQIMLSPKEAARAMRGAAPNPVRQQQINRLRQLTAPLALGIGASNSQ